MKNYYNILGINTSANADDIKKAYRQKAKLHHPDVSNSKNAKENFQLIHEAYCVLTNEKTRKLYDFKFKDDKVNYKKYGTSVRNPSYERPPFTGSNVNSNTSQNEYKAKPPIVKIDGKDKIFFYTLIVLGALCVLFGIYDLIFKEWDKDPSISGVLFGISFLLILIRGWTLMTKKQ